MGGSKRPLDIYVRTSSRGGRSDETLQTLDQQVRDCTEYATREGLSLSGFVLEDRFKSAGAGKRAKRKALAQALDRIRSGESGGILVAYLSRATREGGTGLQLFEDIDRAGGAIYGPNVPSDWKSADGRLVLGLQLIIDAHVVDKAREHTGKAKASSIARGISTSSVPPAGYVKGPDRRYVPDGAMAEVVREAFRMRVAGNGVTLICDHLNARGLLTSRGNMWSVAAVKTLLCNRTYLGELRCGEHLNPTAHEPIVEASLFHAAQAVTRVRRTPRRDARRVYLLSGIARCSACGYALHGSMRASGIAQYKCDKRHGGGTCPNPARANALALEAAVVGDYLADDAVLRLAPAPRADLDGLQRSMEASARRLEQVLSEEARDALGSLWAADVKARRLEHEEAMAALGRARSYAGVDVERLVSLKRHWHDGLDSLVSPDVASQQGTEPAYFLSDEVKRELLGQRFSVIAVERQGRGLWTWFEPEESELPEAGQWNPKLRTLRSAPSPARGQAA